MRRSRNPVRRSNSSPEMSANWKNPFLNKEKLNVQQQLDKDFTCSDLEIKLDAELKKHSKNIYTKDMRYISKKSYIYTSILLQLINNLFNNFYINLFFITISKECYFL